MGRGDEMIPIDMGSEVTLTRLEKDFAGGKMAAVAHERTIGEAGPFALAIAVVDDDVDTMREGVIGGLKKRCNFRAKFAHAFAGRMGIPVEYLITVSDTEESVVLVEIDRQSVEEFVGKQNRVFCFWQGLEKFNLVINVLGEAGGEVGAASANVDKGGVTGKKAGGQRRDVSAKDGLELGGGVEVAGGAEGLAEVVAMLGVIEGEAHELGERQRAFGTNAGGDFAGERGHRL